jgi:hypothetical protein
VAVALADATVAPVHEKLGFLFAGDFAPAIDRFALCFMN